MAHAVQLRAPAAIVEILRDGAYRIELPNGHRAIVRAAEGAATLSVGEQVTAEFHPYDLSRGRIVFAVA